MHVWLVITGEPLPCDPGDARLHRGGLIATQLLARGHRVTWWTSRFDHFRKVNRPWAPHVEWAPGGTLRLLDSCGYQRNVSLQRVRDHQQLGRELARAAWGSERPDVILASFPVIETAYAAVEYGVNLDVPVLVDIRDLWPDVIVDHMPGPLAPLARLALSPMRSRAAMACRRATAVIGPTTEYVAWGQRLGNRTDVARDAVFPFGYSEPLEAPEHGVASTAMADHGGVPTICFAGTVGYQFDFDTVIAAARLLKSRGLAYRWVFAGNGERLEPYRSMTSHDENIVWTGHLDRVALWRLLTHSQLACAPYQNTVNFQRNIPNKIAEYLAAGLPIVAGVDGAIANLLRESGTGRRYIPGDAESLAESVSSILEDEGLRTDMSRQSRTLFEREFTAAGVYDRLVDHLGDVSRAGRRTSVPVCRQIH